MHELVAQREQVVRKLLFAQELHEAVHAIERLQRILHIGGIAFEHLGDNRRVELEPLNGRDAQQLPLAVVEALQLRSIIPRSDSGTLRSISTAQSAGTPRSRR